MHATLLTATILAISGSVLGQGPFCSEADRFGHSTVTPNTGLTGGQTITITSNFTCSHVKGIYPSEVNYVLANIVNNNGYEPNLLVARRTNPDVIVTFQTTVPFAGYFPNASYSLLTQLTYPGVTDSASNITSFITGVYTSYPLGIVPTISCEGTRCTSQD